MTGRIIKISGPVVHADNMTGSKMYSVVEVGDEGLIGEIIQLKDDTAVIQVYEDTTGLKPGEKVQDTGVPLSVELGPGLLNKIYDGIQRPLNLIMEKTGDFIARGVRVAPIEHSKKWHFVPVVKKGALVKQGHILGTVQETSIIMHKVMVPPGIEGKLEMIAKEGDYTIDEVIAKIDKHEVTMCNKWPVRIPRPILKKNDPKAPLITGQRVIDTFFPLAKGGAAAIPGGFGTGKTVTQHQLAKWSDAEVIVYIGCGERGNEMTEVLTEFPELLDPKSGEPLMNRTVLIANTSNMPVAAREASVYTGITIAEYYRDMGYNVAIMADSTSRWAEAMREISGRLEEMPGEEGYPAYLASRIAQFYERAGIVNLYADEGEERIGSISVIGAVSPPGGDFSEPVTQNTLRIVKVFWALDSDLADRRHFPSIDWLKSYSLYLNDVKPWWSENISSEWDALRLKAMKLLQKEGELQEIIQLVGPDALPPRDQVILEGAKMIREDFLRQNAFHKVDTFCPGEKQVHMLKLMLKFYDLAENSLSKGVDIEKIKSMKVKTEMSKMARIDNKNFTKEFDAIEKRLEEEISGLEVKE